jgi:hypothetical protein
MRHGARINQGIANVKHQRFLHMLLLEATWLILVLIAAVFQVHTFAFVLRTSSPKNENAYQDGYKRIFCNPKHSDETTALRKHLT